MSRKSTSGRRIDHTNIESSRFESNRSHFLPCLLDVSHVANFRWFGSPSYRTEQHLIYFAEIIPFSCSLFKNEERPCCVILMRQDFWSAGSTLAKTVVFNRADALRTRKVCYVIVSCDYFPVSPIYFHEDDSCRTDNTLDIFPFSCTRFKNEEGLCLSCCLHQAHFRSAQSHFRLVGPLNRDLISGESRIVNYLRRIDSVWVYWTYLQEKRDPGLVWLHVSWTIIILRRGPWSL